MKKLIFSVLLISFVYPFVLAQNMVFTFNSVDQSAIDSIMAINLATDESVSVKGNNEISFNSTSVNINVIADGISIYPNPSFGQTEMQFYVKQNDDIKIILVNTAGQIVASEKYKLEQGFHKFKIRTGLNGIYLVKVIGDNNNFSRKIITTGNHYNINKIQYIGLISENMRNKSAVEDEPDVIHFFIYSGDRITKIADSPSESKTYEVKFMECKDGDGKNYPVVQIGEQWWMAENLAYLPKVCPPLAENKSYTEPIYYVWGYERTNVSEAKLSDKYVNYGVLYNWTAAVKSCPDDWHLADYNEWNQLAQFISEQKGPYYEFLADWRGVGKHLKTTGWRDGLDDFGFSIIPAYHVGAWFTSGSTAYWEDNNSTYNKTAGSRWLSSYDNDFDRMKVDKSYYGLYVRCIKNEIGYVYFPDVITKEISDTTASSANSGGEVLSDGGAEITEKGLCWNRLGIPTIYDNKIIDYATGLGEYIVKIENLEPNTTYFVRAFATNSKGTGYGEQFSFNTKDTIIIETGTFIDWRDTTEYKWQQIGNQVWMAENLAFLPEVSPSTAGSNTEPFYYVYNYEGTNVNEAKAMNNYETYGVLYNWPAALEACPSGWHLPTQNEWQQLIDYLGGFSIAGGKMKEEGISHWEDPNVGATNESGFTGLPGGYRSDNGEFMRLKILARFYSSTEYDNAKARGRYLYSGSSRIDLLQLDKNRGFSIRCVKD